MIHQSAKDIKERFRAIQLRHAEKWDKANPEPVGPTAKEIIREIRRGKAKCNEKNIAALMKNDWDDRHDVSFMNCLTTPCLERWRRDVELHKKRRDEYVEQLQAAKDAYQDRVLFDHENGYLLLRDFQKWEPGQKLPEKGGDR